MKFLLCTIAVFALVGCGSSYGRRVPDSLVKKLPYEARIDLLEAENDLAIAIDHVDESENEVARSRDGIRRAKDRRGAAEDEVDRAKDPASKEVAERAVREAEARVDYLRARQSWNVDNVEVQQFALECATARFQLARLLAARKSKVEGAERLDPKEFEAQARACEKQLVKRKADLKGDNDHLQNAKATWERQKQALAEKTFATHASPFVE